jgi:hypothetical protein
MGLGKLDHRNQTEMGMRVEKQRQSRCFSTLIPKKGEAG